MPLLESLLNRPKVSEEERQARLKEGIEQIGGVRNFKIWLVLLERVKSFTLDEAEELANLYYHYEKSGQFKSVGELAAEMGMVNLSDDKYLSHVAFNYDFKNPSGEEDLLIEKGGIKSFELYK